MHSRCLMIALTIFIHLMHKEVRFNKLKCIYFPVFHPSIYSVGDGEYGTRESFDQLLLIFFNRYSFLLNLSVYRLI